MDKKKIYIIDIVKALACIMIFCYHCNSLLPGEWKWMTIFGDSLGNNLFFMVSGFALYPSIVKCGLSDLPGWYGRRLIRVLPMLFLFYLLSYLSGFYTLNISGLFTVFIYPSLYWFVTAILFFYIFLFFILKYLPFFLLPVIQTFFMVLWVLRPGTMEAYYFIGFGSMLLGAVLRKIMEDIVSTSYDESVGVMVSTAGLLSGSILFLLINISFSEKIITDTVIRVIFGLSIVLFCSGALVLGFLKNESLKSFFADKNAFYNIIKFTGNLALPLYMVQCFNAGMIGYTIGQRIVFPLSFALNFFIVVGAASLLEFTRILIHKRIKA